MNRKPLTLFLSCLLLCLDMQLAFARIDVYRTGEDELPDDLPERPAWAEGGQDLPAYPADDDLQEVTVDDPMARAYRFELDAKSLRVGDDGVVRYSIVITSKTGTRNVMYEGIRCKQRLYKTYAYGSRKKQLRPIEGAQWQLIPLQGVTAYRGELAGSFFCDGYGLPRTLREIRTRIEKDDSPTFTDGEDSIFY